MPLFGMAGCCCTDGDPPGVNTACGVSGCTQLSTDGTGMNLNATPSGGTSSLVSPGSHGRPANGFTLQSTQSVGSSGTYSVVVFDDPLEKDYQCVSNLVLCAEFLNTNASNSLRVWPCLVQGTDVFVLSSSYTSVTSTTQWTRVTRTFTALSRGDKVTAYNANSIATSSTNPATTGTTHAGFLIQARGSASVQYDAYFDNACLTVTTPCPYDECTAVSVTLSGFTAAEDYSYPYHDCDRDPAAVSLINSLIDGTYLIPFWNKLGSTSEWRAGETLADWDVGSGVYVDISCTYDSSSGDPKIWIRTYWKPTDCSSTRPVHNVRYSIARASFSCGSTLTYGSPVEPGGSSDPYPSTITAEWNPV